MGHKGFGHHGSLRQPIDIQQSGLRVVLAQK